MKAANRVARNTTILYVKMFLTVGVALYSTRLIRQALGDADIGIYNLIAGTVLMLAFINISMAAATQRFMSYAEGVGDGEGKKRIFNMGFVLHIAIAVIAGILMELLGLYLFEFSPRFTHSISPDRLDAARMLYHFTVAVTVVSIVRVPYDAVINAHENMLAYSVIGIIEEALKLGAAAAILYLSGDRLVNYGLLTIAVAVIVYAAYGVYCHKRYEECRLDIKRYFDRRLLKEMTAFSGWSVFTTGASAAVNQGLGLVFNSFFNIFVNTAVMYANRISVQIMGFSTTMVKALNPVIAKSEGGGNRALMLKAVSTGSKAAFYLNTVIAVPFLIETPYVMTLVLGGGLPEWTFAFTRLLLVKNVIESYSYPLNSAISAEGHIRGASIARSVVLLSCLPVMLLLFRAGYEPWLAYAVLIAGSVIGVAILLYYCGRNCGLDIMDYLRRVIGGTLGISLAATLVSLVPYYAMGEGFARLVVVTLVSVAAHGAIIYGVGLDMQEKKLVVELAGKAKKLLWRR